MHKLLKISCFKEPARGTEKRHTQFLRTKLMHVQVIIWKDEIDITLGRIFGEAGYIKNILLLFMYVYTTHSKEFCSFYRIFIVINFYERTQFLTYCCLQGCITQYSKEFIEQF